MSGARSTLLDLAALVWPTACVGCGLPDRDCCDACRAEVAKPLPATPFELGVPGYAAGPYEGALREMLVAYKHAGRTGFAKLLAGRLRIALAAAAQELTGGSALPPLVVAAPSRASRVRERGFRPVEDLLRLALSGPEPVLPGVKRATRALRATRGRTTQVGLVPATRAANAARLTERRATRPMLAEREVLLVDDIATTGATLIAAREALEHAGARVVCAVVVCVAVRRDQRKNGRQTLSEHEGVETGPGPGIEFVKGVTVRRSGPPA